MVTLRFLVIHYFSGVLTFSAFLSTVLDVAERTDRILKCRIMIVDSPPFFVATLGEMKPIDEESLKDAHTKGNFFDCCPQTEPCYEIWRRLNNFSKRCGP